MNTVFPFSGASTSSIPSSLGDSTLDLQGGQKNVIPPDKKNKRNPTIKYRKEVKKPLTKAMERILLGFQVLIIILFAIFVNYDSEQADAVTISQMRKNAHPSASHQPATPPPGTSVSGRNPNLYPPYGPLFGVGPPPPGPFSPLAGGGGLLPPSPEDNKLFLAYLEHERMARQKLLRYDSSK
ncbi:formin-B-like [Folsomia candida]|uniref:formin-B-like n=1 Tax=Folsomia candida TaxID=158441 RepID=UPI0016050943|nr:formin-B-like [Folsomia candida]